MPATSSSSSSSLSAVREGRAGDAAQPASDGAAAAAGFAGKSDQNRKSNTSSECGKAESVFAQDGVAGVESVNVKLRKYPSWVKYIAAVGTMVTGSASVTATKWQNEQRTPKCADCNFEPFKGALLQTFQMFIGESLAGVAWFIDDRLSARAGKAPLLEFTTDLVELQRPIAPWYWWPGASVFDFASTVLFMIAQQRCSNAVVTMLRNFMVVMSGIFQMLIIRKALLFHEWAGVVVITAAMIFFAAPKFSGDDDQYTVTDTSIGVILTIIGTALQSMQLLYEERIFRMGRYPATKAVGIEGVAGMIICAVSYYPFQATLENVTGSLYQMFHHSMIGGLSVLYIFVAFAFNIIGLATTKLGGGVLRGVCYAVRAPMAWIINMITGWDHYDTWCLLGTILLVFGFCMYTSFLPAGLWHRPIHMCCTDPRLDGIAIGHELKQEEDMHPSARTSNTASRVHHSETDTQPTDAAARERADNMV